MTSDEPTVSTVEDERPVDSYELDSSPASMRVREARFNALRMVAENGVEYWNARQLMRELGYQKWERFEDVIARAQIAAVNLGENADAHFSMEETKNPDGPGRPFVNYRVSRYAAYLIAMNGDPRKPEIAAAMHYFAVQTRIAETANVLDEDALAKSVMRRIAPALEALFEDQFHILEERLRRAIKYGMPPSNGASVSASLPRSVASYEERVEPSRAVYDFPKTVQDLPTAHPVEDSLEETEEVLTAREYCRAIGIPATPRNTLSLGHLGSIAALRKGIKPVYDPPGSARPMYPATVWNAARERQIERRNGRNLDPDTGS